MDTRAIDKIFSTSEPLVQIQNNFYRNVPHNAHKQNGLNGAAVPNKMVAKALDKNYLKTTSEPLVQIKNYFTEMFLKQKLLKWFHC